MELIKYNINKWYLILRTVSQLIFSVSFTYFIFYILKADLRNLLIIIVYVWGMSLNVASILVCVYLLCQKIWDKAFLCVKGDSVWFYDCLKRRYTSVNVGDICGLNDYNSSYYPHTLLIIYTVNGKIYTFPYFTEEGKDAVSDIIYKILYDYEKGKTG
ncbi:MAG: hypothetical protein K6A82_01140 [Prevotella sp.]|nr:hypothetical protein [Prevotella sp.]